MRFLMTQQSDWSKRLLQSELTSSRFIDAVICNDLWDYCRWDINTCPGVRWYGWRCWAIRRKAYPALSLYSVLCEEKSRQPFSYSQRCKHMCQGEFFVPADHIFCWSVDAGDPRSIPVGLCISRATSIERKSPRISKANHRCAGLWSLCRLSRFSFSKFRQWISWR